MKNASQPVSLLAGAFLFSVLLCFSGCDLGTYSKRLNDRTAPVAKTEKPEEAGMSGFMAMRQVVDGLEITTTWELKNGKVVVKKVDGDVVDSPEETESEVNTIIRDNHEPDSNWKPTF